MEFQKPSIEQMNANGTHVPILMALATKTTGPVVELGAGHYSTPVLHYSLKNTGRLFVSVDTSREWNAYFESNFKSDNHKYFCTNNKIISVDFLKSAEWGSFKWDVAFVDCGPEYDRARCVELLRNNSKYIIVHDTEPAAVVYNWGNIFNTFTNQFYWDFYGNGTTVVSMTEDLSWLS